MADGRRGRRSFSGCARLCVRRSSSARQSPLPASRVRGLAAAGIRAPLRTRRVQPPLSDAARSADSAGLRVRRGESARGCRRFGVADRGTPPDELQDRHRVAGRRTIPGARRPAPSGHARDAVRRGHRGLLRPREDERGGPRPGRLPATRYRGTDATVRRALFAFRASRPPACRITRDAPPSLRSTVPLPSARQAALLLRKDVSRLTPKTSGRCTPRASSSVPIWRRSAR